MKRRRHTPEQIIRKLREADRLLAEGHDVSEVAKQLEVSEATYHRWRAQYGGLKVDDAKRFKELVGENAWLKRLLAEAELEKDALQSWPREPSSSTAFRPVGYGSFGQLTPSRSTATRTRRISTVAQNRPK